MRALFAAVVLALLAALSERVSGARVLGLFPHPGRSHQMVFEPLLHALATRGHDVTVVSFFPLADPPPNYRDVSLVGLTKPHLDSIDLSVFETNLWGLERYANQLLGMFPLADYALNICTKIVEWPSLQEALHKNAQYDIILIENFNSDCLLGMVHGFDLPIVALLSHNLMPWSSDRLGVPDNPAYLPVMGAPFTVKMTLMERFENAFLLYFHKLWFRHAIQVKEQIILERHFGHKIPDLQDLATNISLMLVNTHHSLNGVRASVPGVVEVGGLHLKTSKTPLPGKIEKFLNESKNGVILFSFGSLIKGSTLPQHRLEIFLKVFSKLPQRIIWKWENEENTDDLEHVMKLKWIPQYDLLHHPKVVAYIGHGGLLGMTEAVDAGVPMVVIPFFGDQPMNAAAAADAGLAIVVPYYELTEQALYVALQKALSPEMRKSAARVSRVWRDRPAPPLDMAVYWVERTARLGPDAQMASPARHLPAYQIALLDVSAVAAILLAALILVIYCIVKLLICAVKLMSQSVAKKVKEH